MRGPAPARLQVDVAGNPQQPQSDLKAYVEGQVDVRRFVRLFARGQQDAIREPGRDRLLSTPTFLGGAAFLF